MQYPQPHASEMAREECSHLAKHIRAWPSPVSAPGFFPMDLSFKIKSLGLWSSFSLSPGHAQRPGNRPSVVGRSSCRSGTDGHNHRQAPSSQGFRGAPSRQSRCHSIASERTTAACIPVKIILQSARRSPCHTRRRRPGHLQISPQGLGDESGI
jgi:hypothetical protein